MPFPNFKLKHLAFTVGTAAAVAMAALLSQPLADAAPSPAFTVHDLGPATGYSIGTGISDNGIVTGAWATHGDLSDAHAFRVKNNSAVTLSNLHGGATSYAFDANAKGRIVGQSDTTGGATHAVYWIGTHPHDLGAYPGNIYSAANGINDSGRIVGYSDVNSDAALNAVLWYQHQVTDLGSFLAGGNSEAYAINNHNAIVGWSDSSSGPEAFIYRHNTMTGLGWLPGSVASYGYTLNDSGLVVGESDYASGLYHAFAYSTWPSGHMIDLGTLAGGDKSSATGVNDQGDIVGESTVCSSCGTFHAFLYNNGRMYDLNNLIPSNSGWVLQEAQSINQYRSIVGYGLHNGSLRAFLLVPRHQS